MEKEYQPEMRSAQEPTEIFDNFDIDLVVKVLSHTLFSPFFLTLVPIFYIFQGAKYTDNVVLYSALYCVAVCSFWLIQWCSRLWRNQANFFFGPGPLDWGEQIVVVTGGASGIGELLANTLAVRNVTVVVLDVKPIITENYNITYYQCDVSKWEEVEAAHKKIVEEIGHPTVIVNNAGVVQGKLILDLSPADIRQTFDVNTLAHFWTLKAFLPEMIKQNSGHIMTMASVAGLVGMAQMTDYCASKAAIVSLHESLRYELDKRYKAPKVRTTLVLPGHVHTPLFSTVTSPSSALYHFLAPTLHPVAIVKAVIAALDEQHSRELRLPFFVHFVPFVKLLPSFLRDVLQWMSYGDYAMMNFVKVSGRRNDEGELSSREPVHIGKTD